MRSALRSLPRRSLVSAPRALLIALSLLVLAACGGGGVPSLPPPFSIDVPAGGPPGGPPGGTTPPPAPPQAPLWQPNAVDLERIATFGSFPSDLVLFGETLFVNDADQVEEDGARIVP